MSPFRPFTDRLSFFVLIALLISSAVSVTPVAAATIVVNNTADIIVPNDGHCTLREAINNANAGWDTTSGDCAPGSTGPDIITVPVGTYILTSGAQLPSITSEITINGVHEMNGASVTILADSCNPVTELTCTQSHRIFEVTSSGNLTINRIRIGHGSAVFGGGILNDGTLTVINSSISNNKASTAGGGVHNSSSGHLTVTNSGFIANSAGSMGMGGGINNFGSLIVTGSNFYKNASRYGGGINNLGTTMTEVDNSTFSKNNASDDGGGIANSDRLTLTDCTVSENKALYGNGGGISNAGDLIVHINFINQNTAGGEGGGIFNFNNLNITNSSLAFNDSGSYGGGISNKGNLTATNTCLANNQSTVYGAGIYSAPRIALVDGYLVVKDSTIFGNSSSASGGGIYIAESGTQTEVINSTLYENDADDGGGGIGMEPGRQLNIINSTLSNNFAGYAGGGIVINHGSELNITNATLFGNSTIGEMGGGISNFGGHLNIANTIIAGSTGGDCVNHWSTPITSTHNLFQDGSCDATLSGDPKLGPLTWNGGPTDTHALLAGSPAIDAGDITICPATDQRNVTRPQGQGCDIGAYEFVFTLIYLPLIHK